MVEAKMLDISASSQLDCELVLNKAEDTSMAEAPTAPQKDRRIIRAKDHRTTREEYISSASHSSEKPLYPDRYVGPGPTTELSSLMDGLDFRNGGSGGGGGGRQGGHRKRRFREDDDTFERRPQRKPRYQQPVAARLRNELLTLGENLSRVQNEVTSMGNEIALNFDDDQVRGDLLDILIQLVVEQPLKIPIVSSIVLYANDKTPEAAKEVIARAGRKAQSAVILGDWREFKLILRFFSLLQGILDGEGVLQIFDDLFDRAVDLQTKSSKDTLGLELVKIILLTIPYLMASNVAGLNDKVAELLAKTDIIAKEQHELQALVEPYAANSTSGGHRSLLFLLQEQLQAQAEQGWQLPFMPQIYKQSGFENGTENESSSVKHTLPVITLPMPANPGSKTLFPEAYLSIYADQDIETVPPASNIASALIRDTLVDTINILDYNRNAVAKFLVETDCYWAPGTFAKRGTPVDKLSHPENQSTWKPEDMALDAIFSQIFFLPTPEHKLVYYHSVTTELCRLSPSTIAPCLGRAMRFLFRKIDTMDMELSYRFMDWFAHHLSNFEFRWKWDEWQENLSRSELHPKKAFIIGAIDKEIRLSFVKRIRDTLPQPYHELIPEGKEKDTPDFKYKFETTPYAAEGQEVLSLLRRKAPDAEVEAVLKRIQEQAAENGEVNPEVPSTDAYMTAICFIGSKSLSHVLSCIERCRDYLGKTGQASAAAADQIIEAVVAYWADHPGVAVNIVDKLLNYTIVTPEGVLRWALGARALAAGGPLADHWRYEMVAATAGKVTNRVRQIAAHLVAASAAGMAAADREKVAEALREERGKMARLLEGVQEAVGPIARGTADALVHAAFDDDARWVVRRWAERWAAVFARKRAVELALVGDDAILARVEIAETESVCRARFEAEERARVEKEEAEKAAKREAELKAAEAAEAAETNGDGRNGDVENHPAMDALDVDEGV